MTESRPPDERPKRRESESSTVGWHRMTGLGLEFIIAVAVMGGIGWYADKKLDSSPWFLLVGGALGFAVGLWNVIRVAMKSFK